MTIKQFASAFAASIAIAALSTAAWTEPTPSSSWTILVDLDNLQPYTGTSVQVTVKLRNISSVPLKVFDQSEFADYAITVKDAEGVAVAYNVKTKQLIERFKNGPVFRSNLIDVAPGKDARAVFDLNEMYDPIRPGKYTVQVERVGSLQVEPGRFIKPKGLVSSSVPFQVRP